jgi:hypothetical protein
MAIFRNQFPGLVIGLLACIASSDDIRAQEAVRPWRVTTKLLSGSSFCAGGMAEVREFGRRFSLHVLNNPSLVLWSITMAADGSAQGEVRGPSVGGTGSSRINVNIPAGSGPRDFEYVNLTYAVEM